MAKKRKDGQYVRRSLVTLELDGLEATLFAPQKVRQIERETPGVLYQARDDVVEQWYIVTTRRHGPGGAWEAQIVSEDFPQGIKLPGKVIERLLSQRDSIIDENRRDSAAGRPPPVRVGHLADVLEGEIAQGEI